MTVNNNQVELSLFQKILLKVYGDVSVGSRMKEGWKNPIEHYAFNCVTHGLQVDYAHGHRQVLRCSVCEKIRIEKEEGGTEK